MNEISPLAIADLEVVSKDAAPGPILDPSDRPNPHLLRFAVEGDAYIDGFSRCYDDPTWDLPSSQNVPIHPHSPAKIRTGIHIALPVGTVGLIVARYSTFEERGLLVPTLILPAGYRGELTIPARNLTRQQITVRRGERVAQLLVLGAQVPETLFQELADLPDDGERGFSGPGSSGR